jgi:hypothetical protein
VQRPVERDFGVVETDDLVERCSGLGHETIEHTSGDPFVAAATRGCVRASQPFCVRWVLVGWLVEAESAGEMDLEGVEGTVPALSAGTEITTWLIADIAGTEA